MKTLINVLILFSLVSCAGPSKILVKNCKSLGSSVYECEEIPKKDLGANK